MAINTEWIGIIIQLSGTIIIAFIMIKIGQAELKKDVGYLKERLEKMEERQEKDISEIKNMQKYLSRTVTEVRINIAKMAGMKYVHNDNDTDV